MALTLPRQVFVYGSLLSKDVCQTIIGRFPTHKHAILRGHRRMNIHGQVYPAITQTPSLADTSCVHGLLYTDLSQKEREIFDLFEDDEYDRKRVTVQITCQTCDDCTNFDSTAIPDCVAQGNEEVEALAYVWPRGNSEQLHGDWSFRPFINTHISSYVEMCQEFVDECLEGSSPRSPREVRREGTGSGDGTGGSMPPADRK